MRKLVELMALLAALSVFGVAATGASAGEVVEEVPLENGTTEVTLDNGSTVVVGDESSGELTQMAKTDCPKYAMCVWSNNDFTGNFSWWNQTPTGCKTHESNPQLRSGLNRTQYTVQLGGSGLYLVPGDWFQTSVNAPITGKICW